MKSLAATSLLLLALASAGPPSAAGAAPPAPRVKAHGVALSGRISRIDRVKMTLSVRDAAGRETPLSWTAATKISGGELKTGDAVTLRYLDKDAQHIATYIRINPPAGAPAPRTATAAPAAASPTARPR